MVIHKVSYYCWSVYQEAVCSTELRMLSELLDTGLYSSGKTTFCSALMDRLDQQEVFVISQDELGSKQKCEQMMQRALSKGQHVIVDRCATECSPQ